MDYLAGWLNHFRANRSKASQEVAGDRLTEMEKRLIGRSIAAFQLGEYSEGKGLMRAAGAYAREIGDDRLVEITKLFILEEQRHAGLLLGYMNRHGIAQLKRHWADGVFRRLRKDVGLEVSTTVLITAEIISLVYYRALRASTGSVRLQVICDEILEDEAAHVRYGSGLIGMLRAGRSWPGGRLSELLHEILFAGTVLVVFAGHGRVLAAGGYGFGRYWRACWSEFGECFGAGRVQGTSGMSFEEG
ncbi:MAG: hypothetical protein AB7U64_12475 [Blastocatellales bacterium]